MFFDFFALELKQRFKSISTYVFFLIPFVMMFFTESARDFSPVPNGKVFLNGPWALTICFVQLTAFGSILISAIFGPSILRDFQLDTYPLLFTKPISKFDYLGGRWAASFVITILVFSGLIFGALVGGLMPWADKARIAPIHFWTYLQPFLSITVIQIFFLGSLFFCVAALTRKIFVVYVQGVAVFMAYLIATTVFTATRSLEHFWSAIFDPVGLRLLNSITRYWTVVERNTQLLSWKGVFLYNRLLWSAVGVLALVVTYVLFPISVEALTAVSQGRRAAKARENEAEETRPKRSLVAGQLPLVHQVFGRRTTWAQFLSLTRMRVSNVLREVPFWAILAVMVVFSLLN